MTEKWELIFAYTRAQALADGVLIDATDTAKGVGFRIPVAFTAAAWGRCVAVSGQCGCAPDEHGRLVNAVWALRRAIRDSNRKGSELEFSVECRNEAGREIESVPLRAVCGPGDDAEPVLTVMMVDED